MAAHEPRKDNAPITEDELGPFLLWFFTHTGHADHVQTWREEERATREAAAKSTTEKR